MKIISFCFVMLFIMSNTNQSVIAAVCTDNPYWVAFKNWASTDTAGSNTDLSQGITQYELNTPAVVNDLGHCKQFNGQSTCCTNQLVTGIKKLVLDKVGKYQNKKIVFQQILNRIKIIAKKCSGQGSKVDNAPDNMNSNKGPKAPIVIEYKKCYAKIIRAAARFSRGNACAICVDPTKFSDYFDNGKLKVDGSTFQQYLDEIKTGFDCLNNLNSQFQSTVNEFFANYTDSTNNACQVAKTKITSYLTNNPICPNNDCLTKIKSSLKVFGDGPENAPTQDDSTADTQIGTTIALRRLLVDTYTEFAVQQSGGVQTYISDSTDSNIQFDGIGPDYQDPNTVPSNGYILFFEIVALIAIISLIL